MPDLPNNLLRPATCPQCDYILRGLPDPIRCPECGLLIGDDIICRGWHGAIGPLAAFSSGDFLPRIGLGIVRYPIIPVIAATAWKLGYNLYKTHRPIDSHIWLSQRGYAITFTKNNRTLTPWPPGCSLIFEAVEGFALIWLITGTADYQRTIIGTAAISKADARECQRRVNQWLKPPPPPPRLLPAEHHPPHS